MANNAEVDHLQSVQKSNLPIVPDDDEDGLVVRVQSTMRKKEQKKHVIRADHFTEDKDDPAVRERQLKHQQVRPKSTELTNELMAAIRRNRFCAMLENKQLTMMVEEMQFFFYKAGEIITNQGETGSYFFVLEDGTVELFINGEHRDTMTKGKSFGGVGLIYNTPRAETAKAKTDTSAWGLHRNTFKKILKEHADKHNAENREFFSSLKLFDGLSPSQQAAIADMDFMVETHQAGERIVKQDEIATAIYVVKRGELSAVAGGTFDGSTGKFSGGTNLFRRRRGDCFGERALLSDSKHRFHVVAETECELVCVAVNQLRQVLGEDLGAALEQSLTRTVLRQLPLFSHLPSTHLSHIKEVIKFVNYEAGAPIDKGFCMIVPVHGEVTGKNADGSEVTLNRGECRHEIDVNPEDAAASTLSTFVAGKDGARVATLTKQDLDAALKGMGISSIGTGDQQRIGFMRRLLLTNKVPVFQQLSEEQVENVVKSLVLRQYTKGARCFTEGEVAASFYILTAGEVSVFVKGNVVRKLKAGTSFGERALLFDEPRSATVEVTTDTAELWSISKFDFQKVVPRSMQRELVQRLHLNDTSVTLKSLRHVRLVGVGSFGSVRLVENSKTAQRYALKRVKKEDGEVPDGVMRECSLLSEIDHPSVLRLVKTFESESSIYILTELITGGELYELLRDRMGRLSRKHTQFYVASLVSILHIIHTGLIVHRDLKPENVMLDQHGYLKIVDFGMAKKGEEGLWRTHTLLGTPLYIAPEMLMGNGYGFAVDIWALGVMMYELACGVTPFGDGEEDTNTILRSILEDDLKFPHKYNDQAGRHLITGLLNKDPVRRLGAGINGWDDVKSAKYFRTGVSGDLFVQIAGREITPPLIPEVENYCSEEELNELVTLSDSEELSPPNPETEHMLKIFRQFDANGDGKICRQELGALLKILDPNTFTESAIDILLNEADWDRDGKLNVEEFVSWLSSCGTAQQLMQNDIHT